MLRLKLVFLRKDFPAKHFCHSVLVVAQHVVSCTCTMVSYDDYQLALITLYTSFSMKIGLNKCTIFTRHVSKIKVFMLSSAVRVCLSSG